MLLFPSLEWLRQEDCWESEANLDYIDKFEVSLSHRAKPYLKDKQIPEKPLKSRKAKSPLNNIIRKRQNPVRGPGCISKVWCLSPVTPALSGVRLGKAGFQATLNYTAS